MFETLTDLIFAVDSLSVLRAGEASIFWRCIMKCDVVVEYFGLTVEQGRLVAKVLGYLRGIEADYFEDREEQAREIDRWEEKFGVGE
jgi:hypothetical protein